ncbi:MAG: sulfatase-like hydrolase/transferase [Rhodocyclales bacterium]|nr:sulfatase-like hydrolase/transferase [Rhodocyclales bacterium]
MFNFLKKSHIIYLPFLASNKPMKTFFSYRTQPLKNHRIRLILWVAVLLLVTELIELHTNFMTTGLILWASSIYDHRYAIFPPVILFLFINSATGRTKLSALLVLITCTAVILASNFKITHLGTPLTISDIIFFAQNIKENSIIFFQYPEFGLAFLLFTLSITTAFLRTPKKQSTAHSHRLACAATALLLTYAISKPAFSESQPTTSNITPSDATDSFYQLSHLSSENRSVLYIIETFFTGTDTHISLPQRLHSTTFKRGSQTPHPVLTHAPDILAILEESTFDPAILTQCSQTSECTQTLMTEKHPGESGPLIVHTTGGGTWLTEFTFLTGLDWRTFGTSGRYAPVSIAPHVQDSLAIHLKRLGYQTIGINPTQGNFLNARSAYAKYGFEIFLSRENLDIPSNWNSVEDDEIFSKTLAAAQALNDGRPQFIFVLTIKNHGPHSGLNDYLTRLHSSGNALKKLETQWFSKDRPRVLAWFGDHQPHFSYPLPKDTNYLSAHGGDKYNTNLMPYITWYAIRDNIHTEIQRNKPLDLSYLSQHLLSYSGLPLQAHGEATRHIEKACPQGAISCPNRDLRDEYLSFRIWDLKEIK